MGTQIVSYEASGTRYYAKVRHEWKDFLFVTVFRSDDPKAYISKDLEQCLRKDSVRIEA